MKYAELSTPWQRVFALAWESVACGSHAFGAVIADDAGNILSEGRNRTGERDLPNPSAVHAETEAICELRVQTDADRLSRILTDFSVHNRAGVEAAKALAASGYFAEKSPLDYAVSEVFDALMQRIEVQHGSL